MRQKSIKIPEENIGSNLSDIGHSNFFQGMSPKAEETKVKMNFWDFIKIKSFCTARKQSTKQRSRPQNGRRYSQMTLQTKGSYPRSIKNSSKSTLKRQIITSKNGQTT